MLKKLNSFGSIWSSDVDHNVFWLLISLSLIDVHLSSLYNQLTPERILPERALASFFMHLKHQREEESYQSEACGLMGEPLTKSSRIIRREKTGPDDICFRQTTGSSQHFQKVHHHLCYFHEKQQGIGPYTKTVLQIQRPH